MKTVYVRATRRELRGLLRQLPPAMSGRAPEAALVRIVRGFKIRLGVAVLSTLQQQFIARARGGADATGLRWKPLSREYLAYQRPMGGRKPPRAGGLSPGGRDGFMTPSQLAQWRAIYRRFLAINAARTSLAEAKEIAAKVAWAQMKRAGVRTKLEVFGNRAVEIGRDRGILFNSLSPGMLVGQRADASYIPPPEQHFDAEKHGELVIGTNVAYAGAFAKLRPLWPDPSTWPNEWWERWLDTALAGLEQLDEVYR